MILQPTGTVGAQGTCHLSMSFPRISMWSPPKEESGASGIPGTRKPGRVLPLHPRTLGSDPLSSCWVVTTWREKSNKTGISVSFYSFSDSKSCFAFMAHGLYKEPRISGYHPCLYGRPLLTEVLKVWGPRQPTGPGPLGEEAYGNPTKPVFVPKPCSCPGFRFLHLQGTTFHLHNKINENLFNS